MSKGVYLIQQGLAELGYDPGPLDGITGARTLGALDTARAAGLAARVAAVAVPAGDDLPWMIEGRKVIGLHETRDNAALTAWLKSDGARLGDPKALPWCGDYVETCIKRALPLEPFTGTLASNPYYARNWVTFGVRTDPTYGAVMVFERGPSSGHVAFAVGQDDEAFIVLGGNQGDAVGFTRIEKSRLLGARWPKTVPGKPISLPRMTMAQALSRNEA